MCVGIPMNAHRSYLHLSLPLKRYKPAPCDNPFCWRFTALSGSADFLAFAIMTQLLWPSRSRSYFQLDTPEPDFSDELEQFSQATHVLNSDRTADQTGDQTREPPPWPLPDVTREAADSSVFSPVDVDTERLLRG